MLKTHRHLTATLQSVREARRFVCETLNAWHRPSVTDDAALLTSEVVTNAVVHAHSDITITLTADDGSVRVEVFDTDETIPQPRAAGENDTNGRGLAILNSIAESWGVSPQTDGKKVWFELPAVTRLSKTQ